MHNKSIPQTRATSICRSWVLGRDLVKAQGMIAAVHSHREQRRKRLGMTAKPAFTAPEMLILAEANELRETALAAGRR